jgi:hypothetical protein
MPLLCVVVFGSFSAWSLRAGLFAISDDDFSRTVIAQEFACRLKLDPSGTSWLPAPFWLSGFAMRLTKSAHEVSRFTNLALTLIAIFYFQFTLHTRARLPGAFIAGVIGVSVPWLVWLGACAVPDAWSAFLLASAVFGLAELPHLPHGDPRPSSPRWQMLDAVILAWCSLSRYEAWPVLLVHALVTAKQRRSWFWLWPLFAPAAWMVWNQFTHGDPLHFFARVSRFRDGHAPMSYSDRFLYYPRELWRELPALSVFCCAAIAWAGRDLAKKGRWSRTAAGFGGTIVPVACALSVLVFLVVGSLRNGAPTHHPVRAMLPAVLMLVPALVARVHAWFLQSNTRVGMKTWAVAVWGAVLAVIVGTHLQALPSFPKEQTRPDLVRAGQKAGREATSATLKPCDYEAFAWLSGFYEHQSACTARVTVWPQGKPSRIPCQLDVSVSSDP